MAWQRDELVLPVALGLGAGDAFERAMQLDGEVFRNVPGRRTVRVVLAGQTYFVKQHFGVGWREIFKNLLSLRLPILGAETEWRAIRKLDELGIPTTPAVAYGRRGLNPASQRSFLITRDLGDIVSLEDFCRDWVRNPPAPELKRKLIIAVAELAAKLHGNGLNHRDFYICHLCLDRSHLEQGEIHLYLIDLHRVGIRNTITPSARMKDLAALYFSALDIGLTARDCLRFLKIYRGRGARDMDAVETRFWSRVVARAEKLYVKFHGRKPVLPLAPLALQLQTRSEIGDTPFQLRMVDGQVLDCQQVVRRVRGKRIVCRAQWQGRAVFAKIFIGDAAARYQQRDQRGSCMLAAQGVATPALLHTAALPHGAGYVLVYAAVAKSINVEEHWQTLDGDGSARSLLMTALVREVARHHQAGLMQTDLYLKNFLLQGADIYTLDGDGMRHLPRLFSRSCALSNLALLISKQDAGDDDNIPQLYRTYCAERGWMGNPRELSRLQHRVENIRGKAARAYQRKVLRTCSDVVVKQDWRRYQAVARGLGYELDNALEHVDTLLDVPHQRLKSGNTCTVSLAEVSGQKVVVKRYNIKNLRHGLSRLWRPSRPARAWGNAFRLQLCGIATAAPLALLERRWGWLRREAYLLAEYVDAPDLAQWMASANEMERQLAAMQVAKLLHKMQRLRLAHGDLKANNLKMVAGAPVLIDLDSMREYRWDWWFALRHARDLRRLLQNWRSDTATLALLEGALMLVYGNDPVLEAAGVNGKTNETR